MKLCSFGFRFHGALLATMLFFCTILTSGHRGAEASDSEWNHYLVIFVNGIWVSSVQNYDDNYALVAQHVKTAHTYDAPKMARIDFADCYNDSSTTGKLRSAIRMKIGVSFLEDPSQVSIRTIRNLAGDQPVKDILGEAVDLSNRHKAEMRLDILNDLQVQEAVLACKIASLSFLAEQNGRIPVVIAHSQGNLFTERALDAFPKSLPSLMRVISLGTPTINLNSERIIYIINESDIVARNTTGAVRFGAKPKTGEVWTFVNTLLRNSRSAHYLDEGYFCPIGSEYFYKAVNKIMPFPEEETLTSGAKEPPGTSDSDPKDIKPNEPTEPQKRDGWFNTPYRLWDGDIDTIHVPNPSGI
jgi:hypothetical protein